MSATSASAATRKVPVTIVYNGLPKTFEVQPNAAIQSLLHHSLRAFGLEGQANLALFTEANVQLDPQRSLSDLGMAEPATLVLRPVAARAGA